MLHVGSRRGVPYHAKLGYALTGAAPVPPHYFTVDAVAALGDGRHPVDFRSEIWPLMAKELTAAHYRELFASHPERTLVSWPEFSALLDTADVNSEAFARAAEQAVPKRDDRFELLAIDRPLTGRFFGSRQDLTGAVLDYVRGDLRRRADAYFSADAAVFDTLLTVYGVLAVALTTGRISPADRIRFVEGQFHGFFSFLASGPPPRRLRELLALHEAGLVQFAGPDLEVEVADGGFVGRSGAAAEPITARALVDARLPRPDVRAATDPVIRGLLADGELAAEDLVAPDGRPLGGGQLLADGSCRAIRADRSVHPRRFLLGPSVSGSAGSAGFSRPGFNGPGFRQNDAVAREILRLLAQPETPAHHLLQQHSITTSTPTTRQRSSNMPVEFLGIAGTNPASEVTPRTGGSLDLDYTRKLARAHEDHGWDRILFAYHSGSPDPAPVAAYVAGHTERINLVLAHRPNVSAPTYAAKTFATLDHISGGRFEVHFITGGSTADQAAEGDFLDKDSRYHAPGSTSRSSSRPGRPTRPSTSTASTTTIKNFRADILPVQQPRPRISFGGSSAAAYAVGAAESDIYALWGEPLAGTREQIASIDAAAAAAGRPDRPTLQIAFRPIIAPTEELAWEKAESILGRINAGKNGSATASANGDGAPENAGSQRLLAVAAGGERHDRALWTAPTAVTGGGGNSTALVGTPGDGRRGAARLLRPRHRHPVRSRLRHLRRRHRFRPVRHPAGPRGGRQPGRGAAAATGRRRRVPPGGRPRTRDLVPSATGPEPSPHNQRTRKSR